MSDFKEFIETVKERTDIADIVEATGTEYRLHRVARGGWFYGSAHDSLAVNPTTGQYEWFSHSDPDGRGQYEHGDVFTWLQRYQRLDFYQALEMLAQRAGLEMPKGQAREKSEAEISEEQNREKLYRIAMDWFENQLWSTPAALAYARSRGWTEETIRFRTVGGDGKVVGRGAGVGFSGAASSTASLRERLELSGLDVHAPEAVALVGFKGDVATWAKKYSINTDGTSWIEQGRIYGITDFPRLVYPHLYMGSGRPIYFSCRNLAWENGTLRAVRQDEKAPRMWNPQRELVGERALYCNFLFSRTTHACVIVEGQGDAVSLAQWKFAAVALNGLALGGGPNADVNRKRLQWMLEKIGCIYIGTDNDEEGRKARESVTGLVGGMARVVVWQNSITESIHE